jgi:phosphate-selective porin OprO/OprP
MHRFFYLLSVLSFLSLESAAQTGTTPYFNYRNGLGFATPDSAYSINLRFRIQNRVLMNTISDTDLGPESFEGRVRRCRLTLTGHVVNPKFTYYIQLSFARGDMDWSVGDPTNQNVSPNVLRDGMLFYRPSSNLVFGLGQGKLPGNRQRVNSSSSLQFYDRSLVNVNYTTDRDFGFFMNYSTPTGHTSRMNLKLAVTTGEGRNSNLSDNGLAYTARVEYLPFGNFTDGGDFFEGDVVREEKPKLSIGGGYMYNDMAVRTGGQIGRDLYGKKSFSVIFADLIFKFRGFGFLSEYMRRDANNPYVLGTDNAMRLITTGDGINNQLSYCFRNMWELCLRQTLVSPHRDVLRSFNQAEQYGIGVNKYFNRHKVKAQFNILYNKERNLAQNKDLNKFFTAVFQLEVGI